jgi:hypothetical protein
MSNGQHQQVFQQDLMQDEKILWSGQPEPSIDFNRSDIFLIPFSLLWGGVALIPIGEFCLSIANGEDGGGSAGHYLIFFLFAIVFSIIGLHFIFGRFLYKRWKKRRTYYAITARRALILTATSGRKLQGVFLDRVPALNKSVRRDGIGTIQFGNSGWVAAMYSNTGLDFLGGFYGMEAPAFYDINDADSVFDLANSLR